MPDRSIYEFAIIRVVPKVERGECLNIGVIVFSKKLKYLDMKYHLDVSRLRAFSNDIDIDDLDGYLKGWQHVCAGGEKGGAIGLLELPKRFRWLTASRSTIIQSSPVHSGTCVQPGLVLEHLFQKFVL